MERKSKITKAVLFSLADQSGYIKKQGRSTPTLRITENGTIYRADTDLTLCRSMTVSEAAKALGLS